VVQLDRRLRAGKLTATLTRRLDRTTPKYRGVIKRRNKYYYRIYRNGTQKEYGGFSTTEEDFNARNEHLM